MPPPASSAGLSLRAYRDAFSSIHGAFTLDAACLFFAYGQLAAEAGASGSVLEIGVGHGLSLIAVAALRGTHGTVVAVDTFGAHDVTASGGMGGDERTLRANIAQYHGGIPLRVIAADSRTLGAADLGGGFGFCHIDGGHSAEETAHDLSLAADVSLPGGLVALDDYFNPSFPGVSEGTVRFLGERRGDLVPLAIGANKVIFRRAPAHEDLNALLTQRDPSIPRTRAVMDGHDVLVFGAGVAAWLDVDRSTSAQLVPREVALRVDLVPEVRALDAAAGATVPLPVRVRNRSDVPLAWSDTPFGLSYHLGREDGASERYENPRAWFIPPLGPGEERVMTLQVVAPGTAGDRVVEVDVVWEGICWLRERGNRPAQLPLRVR